MSTTNEILAVIRRLAEIETRAEEIKRVLKVLITQRYGLKEIEALQARREIDAMNLEAYYSAEDRLFFGEHRHTKLQDAASKDARRRHKRMKDNLLVKYKALVTLRRKKAGLDPETEQLPEESPEELPEDPQPSDPHPVQEETANQNPDPEPEQEPEEAPRFECPICLDSHTEDGMVMLVCDHALCMQCMESLITQRQTPHSCCLCRKPITRPVKRAFRERVRSGFLLV